MPTLAEITREIDVPVDRLVGLLGSARVVVSIDQELGDESDATFAEFAAVSEDETEREALAEAVRAEIARGLGMLSDREQEILVLRYGLDGGVPLQEIRLRS